MNIDNNTHRRKSLAQDVDDLITTGLQAFSEGTIHNDAIEAFLDSDFFEKLGDSIVKKVNEHVYYVLDVEAANLAEKIADW